MSMLKYNPPVLFEVNKSEHRQYYNNFRAKNTWSGAPRFVLEEQFTNVPDMIASKMLDYYMQSEFASKAPE
jgi:hypothetical protein